MSQGINKPTEPAYASPYDPQMSIDGIVKFFRNGPADVVENGTITIPTLLGFIEQAKAQINDGADGVLALATQQAQQAVDAAAATAEDRADVADMAAEVEANADRAENAAEAAEDSIQYNYLVADNAALGALTGMTSGQRAFVRSTEHVWHYSGSAWVDDGLAPTAAKADKTALAAEVSNRQSGDAFALGLLKAGSVDRFLRASTGTYSLGFGGAARAVDASDLSGPLDSVDWQIKFPADADRARLLVYQRTAGDGTPGSGLDTLLHTVWRTATQLGLAPGASTTAWAAFPLPEAITPSAGSGLSYVFVVESFASDATTKKVLDVGYFLAAGLSVRYRGWIRVNPSASGWAGVDEGYALAIRLRGSTYFDAPGVTANTNSAVSAAAAAGSAAAQAQTSADTVRKLGSVAPVEILDRVVTPNATTKWTANATYIVRNWRQWITIRSAKIINAITFPLTRDLFNNVTISGSVLVRIGINGAWVKTLTIPNSELASYNALTTSSPAASFDYTVDLSDTELKVGDVVVVAWEVSGTDRVGMVYGTPAVALTEGLEGFGFGSNAEGLIAGYATPPAIPGSPQSFYLRVQLKYKRYIASSAAVVPVALTVMPPKKVYTVMNDRPDFLAARQNSIPLYLEHFTRSFTSEPDLRFVNEQPDCVYMYSPQTRDNGVEATFDTVVTSNKSWTIRGPAYTDTVVTVEQKSTKESAARTKTILHLPLGDSTEQGYLSNQNVPSGGPTQKCTVIAEEFHKAKIDYGDLAADFNYVAIGRAEVRTWNLTYGGVTNRPLRAGTEGMGGWALSTHVHLSRNWAGSPANLGQGMWDLLGLGNGSGTDFTGSSGQRLTLNTTPEGKYAPTNTTAFRNFINSELSASAADYAAAVALLNAKQANPENKFYDKATAVATDHAFSVAAYLARYQTLAPDGKTRLVVGSTAGSSVTDVNAYDVCRPTHITIQHSHNGNTGFATNMRRLTNAIKAEYSAQGWAAPFIGIGIVPFTGTFYPSRYPEFELASIAYWLNGAPFTFGYDNQQTIFTEFWQGSANEDSERIYMLPTFHITPGVWGTPTRSVNSPEYAITGQNRHTHKVINGAGPTYHPNGIANRVWGLEFYAWLVYTATLMP